MTKAHYETKISRNFSIAMVWINGGSNMDIEEKKKESIKFFAHY